jgi:hypothetical protein
VEGNRKPDSQGALRLRIFRQFGGALLLIKCDGLECLDNGMDDAFMAKKGIESKK